MCVCVYFFLFVHSLPFGKVTTFFFQNIGRTVGLFVDSEIVLYFVPSWERSEHVVLAPLAQEVLEVSHSEKIWHDRY